MKVTGLLIVLTTTILCSFFALLIPFAIFHKKDPISYLIPLIEFCLYLYFQVKKKQNICYVGRTRIENTTTSWIWILVTITGISIFTNLIVFN